MSRASTENSAPKRSLEISPNPLLDQSLIAER
jgi:hypothetical protein